MAIEDKGDVVNSNCGLGDGNINGLLITGGPATVYLPMDRC